MKHAICNIGYLSKNKGMLLAWHGQGGGRASLLYKDVRVRRHGDRQLCNQRLLVRSELFQLELKQLIGVCRQHTGQLANSH